MIPSHELRIGNHVLFEQNVKQIVMIDGTRFTTLLSAVTKNASVAHELHPLDILEPVPLTDSVLRQCNFVYHDYFKFWQLIAGSGNDRSEMDIDGDYNLLDFMRRPVVKKLSSLHQLQNLFYQLKGKELEVRVPA